MRLDKFLVENGLGSRSQVKDVLKKGLVLVNGRAEKSPKTQINETADEVVVSGQKLTYEKFVYYLLNKPKGYISAQRTNDIKQFWIYWMRLLAKKKYFLLVAWHIDTHGLLLLTNNGKLAHAMLSPKKHVEKIYRAKVAGLMNQSDVERFARGIELKDFTCHPAQLKIVELDEEKEISLVEITLAEGKFHQVKRMVAACGKEVTDLQRLTMGPLQLDPALALGEWRRLTEAEILSLEIFGVEL